MIYDLESKNEYGWFNGYYIGKNNIYFILFRKIFVYVNFFLLKMFKKLVIIFSFSYLVLDVADDKTKKKFSFFLFKM